MGQRLRFIGPADEIKVDPLVGALGLRRVFVSYSALSFLPSLSITCPPPAASTATELRRFEEEKRCLHGKCFVAAAVLLAAASAAPCQNYLLTETVQVGDCFHVALDMKLAGDIHVRKGDAAANLKVTATGSHEYPERVLAVGDGVAQKTARVYETAKAVVTVNGDATERTLRPERRLVVAQRDKEQLLVYSAGGAFTQEELELAHDHFDTLALSGLLPGKAVAVGDTWKINNAVAEAVCNFEGVTEQTLTGKLESVKDDIAVFSISGISNGIDQGAMVKMVVKATGQFDLKSKRLTALEWKQNDERNKALSARLARWKRPQRSSAR